MGTVFCAEHILIGRLAAIKVLHPEFSGNKDIVNRFFNEAKATTSINHPGIVEVFDYGYMPGGDGYLVMEYLDGMSLGRRLKRGGRFNEGEGAMLLRGVCMALAAAHAKGIVHRDLKPDNIFLIADPESELGERAKVLDFGIAKLTDVGLAGSATKTGAVMGTPTYMSPEQCRGTGEVDHRADLYSLGCILYELMCGRPPFCDLGAGELIGAHLHVTPELPTKFEPKLSDEMEQLIVTLLEKNPANRLQTAQELAGRLGQIAKSHGYQVGTTHPSGITTTSKLARAQKLPPIGENHPQGTEYEIQVTPGTMSRSLDEADSRVDKPTTLSGSAVSHPVIAPPKNRRGAYFIAGSAAVSISAVAIAIVMTSGRTTTTHSATARPQPAPAAAPIAAPAPAPAPAPMPDPAPAPVPVAVPAAVPDLPSEPKATPPVAAVKHVQKPKPKVMKPPQAATKPDKPAPSDKINGPIETDL